MLRVRDTPNKIVRTRTEVDGGNGPKYDLTQFRRQIRICREKFSQIRFRKLSESFWPDERRALERRNLKKSNKLS